MKERIFREGLAGAKAQRHGLGLTGVLRGTWGLTGRRGRARRHGVGKETLAFPRPHRWLDKPGETHSTWTDYINSRIKELFAVRQTEGGQSFQRLGSPETWVGPCTRTINSHPLGDFVSFLFIFSSY